MAADDARRGHRSAKAAVLEDPIDCPPGTYVAAVHQEEVAAEDAAGSLDCKEASAAAGSHFHVDRSSVAGHSPAADRSRPVADLDSRLLGD